MIQDTEKSSVMKKNYEILTDLDFDKLPKVCTVLEISVKVLEVCGSYTKEKSTML